MNLEELKKSLPEVAASAENALGAKAQQMTFLLKDNGWVAFMQVGDWFQWYWFDSVKQSWRETHMLHGENWLYHEEVI